jgi:DNA-binding transcriptional MerR regulator
MTNGERLTLAELAGAVGMTARNVRAYQTRGLLQPPRRVGRSSVYGTEHVRRLEQVQRARARGASLSLLQTLIAEGRDLDGVWSQPASGRVVDAVDAVDVVDVTDLALWHTPDCLARREVPLAPLLARLASDADSELSAAVRALVDAGVFTGSGDEVRVPGSFACAVEALHDQGHLASDAAVRLAVAVGEAARAVTDLVASAARTVDPGGRGLAAQRLGELAAAVVDRLAGRQVLATGLLTADS